MAQEGIDLPEADPSSSRPASTAVLSELEALREGTGISPERIRGLAPRTQELAVVSDQLDYQAFHPSDRHLAAYAAIGCVIEKAIDSYQHQQILILSLRYDPSLLSLRRDESAWSEVRKAPTLRQRDALVQALLFYKKSAYYEMRKDSYRELANQLAMRSRTPCRESGANHLAAETLRFSLRQILGYFTIEGREVFREVLAEEALRQVSQDWKRQRNESSVKALDFAISIAIRKAYPAAVAELARVRYLASPDSRLNTEICFNGKNLERLLRPTANRDIWATFAEMFKVSPPRRPEPEGKVESGGHAVWILSESLDALSWVLSRGAAFASSDFEIRRPNPNVGFSNRKRANRFDGAEPVSHREGGQEEDKDADDDR